MKLTLNPRRLTPTIGVREADETRISAITKELADGCAQDPLVVAELHGHTIIIDGHHRWAAHILVHPEKEIAVELIDSRSDRRTSKYGDDVGFEVNWSEVYDWEELLGTILYNGAYDLSLNAIKPILLSGPSGVGKNRLIHELRRSGLCVPHIKTTTTRAQRESEAKGVDYDFVDVAGFRSGVENGEFCEWQLIHGNYYGCKWSEIFDKDDRSIRIKDLDPYGALQLKAMFPRFVTTAFVTLTDFDQLRNRIATRGTETPKVAQKRISRARTENQLRHMFDFVLHNDEMAHALAGLQEVVSQSRAASAKPHPFFQDRACRETYIALDVQLSSGRSLSWRNLSHEIVPMLTLPAGISMAMAFRLLESMVLDQLSGELAGRPQLGAVLRALVTQLTIARPLSRWGQGDSGQLTFFIKSVSAPDLEPLLEGTSFFGARRGLHPEDRHI